MVALITLVSCASQTQDVRQAAAPAASQHYMYVDGEVGQPGPKVWNDGITLAKAIDLSGGFTEAADKSRVLVTRADGAREVFAMTEDANSPMIKPGDMIQVKRALSSVR